MQAWSLKRIIHESMTLEDRGEYFKFCAELVRRREDKIGGILFDRLQEASGFRRDSLAHRMPVQKLADLISRLEARPELELGLRLALVAFHLEIRRKLVTFCLDEWGMRHTSGALEEATAPPSVEDARRVYKLALIVFPISHVRTYFAAQGLLGRSQWRDVFWTILDQETEVKAPTLLPSSPLPETVSDSRDSNSEPEKENQEVSEESSTPLAVEDDTRRAPLHAIPRPAPEPSRLATLDRLMITETVRAVAGDTGAMSIEELDDAIEDLLSTNSRRYQSYFHRGFLDGLLGKEMAFVGGEMNDHRKVWIFTGHVTACARRGDHGGVTQLALQHQGVFSALARPYAPGAARTAVPLVIDAFARERRIVDLAGLLSEGLIRAAGDGAFRRLLEVARDLYRSRSAVEAERFLEILARSADRQRVPVEFFLEIQRRQAQCRKAFGAFDVAIEKFQAILPECGPEIRSSVLSDIGLARGSFRWLVEVRLPRNQEHALDMRRRLDLGADDFSAAIDCLAENDANAPYALGVRELLLALETSDSTHEKNAIMLLRRAYENALQRVSIYRETGVMGPLCFAYACAIFLTLDDTQFDNAAEMIRQCVDALPAPEWPQWVLEHCAAAALEFDTSSASTIIGVLHEVHPSVLHRYLENRLTAPLPGHVLRNSLCEAHLEKVATDGHRAVRLRWDASYALARRWSTCADTSEWSGDRHAEILDLMLELARQHADLREQMDLLLAEGDLCRAVWDSGERLRGQAALAAWDGRIEEAMDFLLSACRYSRESSDLDGAAEILEQMREQAPRHPRTLEAEALLPATSSRSPLEGRALAIGRALRILFVGGNETQMRYEADLKTDLSSGRVPVQVDFEFTGWTSNWGAHLDRIVPRLEQYDGVVIMEFVRTQFGRNLNAAISKLNSSGSPLVWKRCTGHGKQSMRLSIEACAAMVLDRKEQLHATTC